MAKKINSRIFLERTPWDSVCDGYLARIPMDDPACAANHLAREVVEGRSQAWLIKCDGLAAGIAITRIDASGVAREFVIQSMFGETPDGFPVCSSAGYFLEDEARKAGCVSVRFHTVRHALARAAAEQAGYRLAEVIMRKTL